MEKIMVLSVFVLIGPVYYFVNQGVLNAFSLNEYKYMSAEIQYRHMCFNYNNTNIKLQLKCNQIKLKCHNYYIEEVQMFNECEKIKTKMPHYLSVHEMSCTRVKSYNFEHCLIKYDNDSNYSSIIFIKQSIDAFNRCILLIYLITLLTIVIN